MRFGKTNYEFHWIGEGFPCHRPRNKIRYQSFSIGDLKINVGDYVLVRNDEALDPENTMSCYTAQVTDLFDTGEDIDPHQAQVQWFSRIPELPHYASKSLKTLVHNQEIVQEKRSTWSNVIDAETIFQRCEILFLTPETDYESVLSKYEDHPFPVFFCRYTFYGTKLIGVKKEEENTPLKRSTSFSSITPKNGLVSDRTPKNEYAFEKCHLDAVKKDEKTTPLKRSNSFTSVTPSNGVTNGLTPKTKKKFKNDSKKNLFQDKVDGFYCATPIGNPAFPKVLIKKIDDKILESKNGNVRIFVAESIEDVTEKFMKNLNLEKSNICDSPKRHPIIHSLSAEANASKVQQVKSTESEINSCVENTNVQFDLSQTPKTKKSLARTNGSAKSVKKEPLVAVRNSPRRSVSIKSLTECPSPRKKAKVVPECSTLSCTRSGRRVKTIDYTEIERETKQISKVNASPSVTKRKKSRCVRLSFSDDSDSFTLSSDAEGSSHESSMSDSSLFDDICKPLSKSHISSPRTPKTPKTPSRKASKTVSTPRSSIRKNTISLSIPDRKTPLKAPKNVLEESRQRLHVSAVPASLPCREEEYSDIYSFVKGCLCAQAGGCMYISGLPGTGKTATVQEVMRNLEEEKESGDVPIFTYVEVNGMWMTDPYQAYVHIFKSLTGNTIAPQQAANLLEKRFTEKGPKKDAVVLLVDELDRLWTRKQTVMYNIFDWPTKKNSKLVVLAIANTMDLPERMMMNRISSRLGLTRKTFQPYTFRQLQEIIMSRIQELKVFDPDAVQLVARKVAAVSGDARRALDICRFATEVVKMGPTPKKGKKIVVGMEQVDIALQQIFSSPLVSAIRSSSKIAKLFFQCILSEFSRTGLEETTLLKVSQQVISCCRFEGIEPPNSSEISRICADLASQHLILVDSFRNDIHMKIRLNVNSDDVTYALTLH